MFSAFTRAVADLSVPGLRRVLALGLTIAITCFAALWIAVALVLGQTTFFAWRPLNWLADLLGVATVLVVSWLVFPAVVTIVMGFFLERIATAIETMHYPGSSPARRSSIAETVTTTVRLMAITLLLNLLALPVYILVPGVNFFVFLGLNGYLFGREYFEVVALRRLEPHAARALRHRFAGRVFVAGTAIAGIFAVPLVNLLAPVIATAFMLHFFEGLPRLQPQLRPS
jgi:CysZ protein